MGRLEEKEREIQEFASRGELTGGRSFDVREMNPETLRHILSFLAGQVMCEYIAGIAPEPSDPPKKHKLEVKLRSKETGKVLGGSRTVVH
jgi:hypothetical protein